MFPDGEDAAEVLAVLCDLADKQWHSYQKIDRDLAAAIERWIEVHWCGESLPKVEGFIFVIAHLGLENAYQMIVSKLEGPLVPEVRQEIVEYQREAATHDISNPYSGLERSLALKQPP